MKQRALVLAGYGLNCEYETARFFAAQRLHVDIAHITTVAAEPDSISRYDVLAIPGGFSFADDLGSGNALAHVLRTQLLPALQDMVARGKYIIGICNGCQVLCNLGLVPNDTGSTPTVGLATNAHGRFECRTVSIAMQHDFPYLQKGIMRIPVAHGEGRFVMDAATRALCKEKQLIAAVYVDANGAPAQGRYPDNPNGSQDDIAALTDTTGRILAMMPHPERI